MLRTVRLRNFRSYVDTGDIDLRKLNVFIGPNNAGKSALLSTIELFLRSLRGGGTGQPLAFEAIPSFASFDSVLRRHWSPKEARRREFVLTYRWDTKSDSAPLFIELTCKGRPNDNTSYVDEVEYKHLEGKELHLKNLGQSQRNFSVRENGKESRGAVVLFQGPMPFIIGRKVFAHLVDDFTVVQLEVVYPYRPVPRSFYVLDDPGLSPQDRALLSFLIEIWGSQTTKAGNVRQRIVASLTNLGLVHHFAIKQVGKKLGPKVVEIQVAPFLKRQSVSIADVGFGLSQVLPLAAFDARLENGYLLAYQPEVHLHPYAQARLADLFSGSVQRGNQVFVETHSPDLILRLQSIVVSGEISPNDVRVFCLSNLHGETSVTPVDFDPKGSPAIPWPPGFLDTSFTLARELVAQRAGLTQ